MNQSVCSPPRTKPTALGSAQSRLLVDATETHEDELSRGRARMGELRGADAARPEPEGKAP